MMGQHHDSAPHYTGGGVPLPYHAEEWLMNSPSVVCLAFHLSTEQQWEGG